MYLFIYYFIFLLQKYLVAVTRDCISRNQYSCRSLSYCSLHYFNSSSDIQHSLPLQKDVLRYYKCSDDYGNYFYFHVSQLLQSSCKVLVFFVCFFFSFSFSFTWVSARIATSTFGGKISFLYSLKLMLVFWILLADLSELQYLKVFYFSYPQRLFLDFLYGQTYSVCTIPIE